uniref:Uncharacterized protein n=1 Tax=Rhizophora mucronata TaxID=61149 RepID=A0A2P2NTL1_RHIMU
MISSESLQLLMTRRAYISFKVNCFAAS